MNIAEDKGIKHLKEVAVKKIELRMGQLSFGLYRSLMRMHLLAIQELAEKMEDFANRRNK